MLSPKASNSATTIVRAPGHRQHCLHYILTNLTDTVAVKDTSKGQPAHIWPFIRNPKLRLWLQTFKLLKTQNRGLPAEAWSPTGQRLHHLIGFLPEAPQAFLLLMSFKAERHLTCLPTPRAGLIYTAQKGEGMSVHLVRVTVCHLHVVISSSRNMLLWEFWFIIMKQKCKLCRVRPSALQGNDCDLRRDTSG